MITATGNNFGAGTIQLKDYQSDKMVVLNGRVALDPDNTDYQAAKQLEIYVPDLALPKSTQTAIFQHGLSWTTPVVTALRSWIKNKNTIVVEKPIVLRSASAQPVLDFLCAYVPKGVRFAPDAMTPVTLAIEDATLANMSISYQQCFITDGWVFLAMQLYGAKTPTEGDAFSFRLAGLPSGLAAQVPFFFNSSTYSTAGSFEVPITFNGDCLSCEGVSGTNWREGYIIETRVFLVR